MSQAEEIVTKPPLKPLKSALRKPLSQQQHDNDKPVIKRSVTFIPGFISGKSDVTQMDDDDDSNSDGDKDDDDNDDINKKDDASNDDQDILHIKPLNFTNWRFGGAGFSGSETSDDEKDFGKMNDKYKLWSPQYAKQQEIKQKMDAKLKKSIRKLRNTKKNIKKLKKEIDNNDNDNDDGKNDKNTNNSRKRKRRSRSNSNSNSNSDKIENEYKKWKKKQNQKGVIYISSVPFGCTTVQLKKIFNEFGFVTNIHLEAAKGDNGSIKKIYNKWTEFCEGWIEFKDKKIAKQVVELLNETKIPKKYVKNKLAKSHIWNMKYLKGFGWHHLNEYKKTIRTLQRKKYDAAVADAHRTTQYFKQQVKRAKNITKNWNNNNNNNNDNDDGDDDKIYYESSDDELPPAKRQKTVQQRSVRKRRNHGNRHLKQITNKLMK